MVFVQSTSIRKFKLYFLFKLFIYLTSGHHDRRQTGHRITNSLAGFWHTSNNWGRKSHSIWKWV